MPTSWYHPRLGGDGLDRVVAVEVWTGSKGRKHPPEQPVPRMFTPT